MQLIGGGQREKEGKRREKEEREREREREPSFSVATKRRTAVGQRARFLKTKIIERGGWVSGWVGGGSGGGVSAGGVGQQGVCL